MLSKNIRLQKITYIFDFYIIAKCVEEETGTGRYWPETMAGAVAESTERCPVNTVGSEQTFKLTYHKIG